MREVRPDSTETRGLLERVADGDAQALGRLLERHRPGLSAFVEARLDSRIQARIDPSDVVQEALLEVSRRMDGFLKRRPLPERSSLLLAGPLLAGGPSPSQRLQARELADRVARAVAGLSDADREVPLMRHAEELPHEEITCRLGIEPAAARKRYGRALIRLQKVLTDEGLLE